MSNPSDPAPAESNSASLRSRLGLWLGPAVFLFMLLFVDLDPANPLVTRMAAVILLMAIWWITEAIPLAATALLPIVLAAMRVTAGLAGSRSTNRSINRKTAGPSQSPTLL